MGRRWASFSRGVADGWRHPSPAPYLIGRAVLLGLIIAFVVLELWHG